jgi:hypothetical protein
MWFVKAIEDEKGVPPTAGAFQAMDRFADERIRAGVFVAATGLKNSIQARRIAFDRPSRVALRPRCG